MTGPFIFAMFGNWFSNLGMYGHIQNCFSHNFGCMFHSRNCEKFVLKPVVLNVLQPHYSMARTIWNCYFKTVCTGLFMYGLTFKQKVGI